MIEEIKYKFPWDKNLTPTIEEWKEMEQIYYKLRSATLPDSKNTPPDDFPLSFANYRAWVDFWEEILQELLRVHPRIRPLVESGRWDAMSRRERILYDLDHIIDPWTKEGLDNYNNAMEKTDAEYEKVCQEIPDDIYDDEEDDDDDDYDYNEEDDDDDDDEYDYDYNEEDDDDDEYDYNEEDDDE